MDTFYTQNPVAAPGEYNTCDPRTPCAPVPPTPTPQTRFVQYGGSLNPGIDFDELIKPRRLVEIRRSSVDVEVRANMLVVDVVERGNRLVFIAKFEGEPDEVFFSYIKPGKKRPIVDPGYGHPDSSILKVGDRTYAVSIDTTGFEAGTIQWHLWGTGVYQASDFGEIVVPARPPQLL